MPKISKTKSVPRKKTRQRYPPAERRQMILEGAIKYYAEYGFDGRTRGFAEFLGISQSLIFRYFPNTEALIDSVYEVVYLNRWDTNWEETIKDRSTPLGERLTRFYTAYHRRIDQYDSIRIALFSALRGDSVSARYFERLVDRIINPIIIEIRDTLGLPTIDEKPLLTDEMQMVFALHGTVSYSIIRTHVFGLPTSDNMNSMIKIHVDAFIASLQNSFERIHEMNNQQA